MQLLPAGLSLLFLISTATLASSHNITAILNNFPEFSFFNLYLTQTHLAAEINSHKTITVCAIDNAGMAQLLTKPLTLAAMKRFLSVHVLVDYFGAQRIQQISDGTLPAPTMFQAMGARKFNILLQNVGGQVTLKTKLVDARITDTLYDQQTLAIYKLDSILLPREMFTPNFPKRLNKKIHQISEYRAESPPPSWVSGYLADAPSKLPLSVVSGQEGPSSSVSGYLADAPSQLSEGPSSSVSGYLADAPSQLPEGPSSSVSGYLADAPSQLPEGPSSSVSGYLADALSQLPEGPSSSVSGYLADALSQLPEGPSSSVSGYLADAPSQLPLPVSGLENPTNGPSSSLYASPADSPRSLVSSD